MKKLKILISVINALISFLAPDDPITNTPSSSNWPGYKNSLGIIINHKIDKDLPQANLDLGL